MQSFNLDVSNIGLDTAARYKKSVPANSKLINLPGPLYTWMGMNTQNPKLSDIRVRKAIQRAVDVKSVIDGAYAGASPQAFGVVPVGILGHRPIWLLGHNTIWAIIIPSVWRGLPFAMLIFLAGLQAMPQELHEAAAIDGAGPFRRFRYITLPLLRPLIAVQLLFSVIYAAYQFAIPVILLGSNPGPDADLMMTLIVRQSFSNNLFGFGSAASVLLMIAMCGWIAIWYAGFRRDMEATG